MLNRRSFIKKLSAGIAAIPFAPAILYGSTGRAEEQPLKSNQLHIIIKGPGFEDAIKPYGESLTTEVEKGLEANNCDFVSIGDGARDISINEIKYDMQAAILDPKYTGKEIIIHHNTHGNIDEKTGKHGICLTNAQCYGKDDLLPSSEYFQQIDSFLSANGQKTKIFMISCFGNKAQEEASKHLSDYSTLVTASGEELEILSAVNLYKELQTGNYKGKELGPYELACLYWANNANVNPQSDSMQLQTVIKGKDTIIDSKGLAKDAANPETSVSHFQTKQLMTPFFGDKTDDFITAAEEVEHSRLPSFIQTKLPLLGAVKNGFPRIKTALQNIKPVSPPDDIVNDKRWDGYSYPIIKEEKGRRSLTFEKLIGKDKGEALSIPLPDFNTPKYNNDFFEADESGLVTKYEFEQNTNKDYVTIKAGLNTVDDYDVGKLKVASDEIIIDGNIKRYGSAQIYAIDRKKGSFYSVEANLAAPSITNEFSGPIKTKLNVTTPKGKANITEAFPNQLTMGKQQDSFYYYDKMQKMAAALEQEAKEKGLLSSAEIPKPQVLTANNKAKQEDLSRREFVKSLVGSTRK